MAIVQISRITARKGLETDLPQPLAGAELGWAVDQRKLYIGNGTLEEGAPTVGNTEILTEYSNLFAISGSYTYKGEAAGYIVQTGPTGGDPATQTLQSRLDSYCVVTNFGAVGDGVTDNTVAINRALFQLYCRDNNPAVRRSLFFPAGVYIISDTILLPPYAFLYGEGADSSVITFRALDWTSSIAYTTGVLVQDGANYYRSLIDVPAGIDISNITYWVSATLPGSVVATADSLQQTSASIGTNGAIPPQWISLNTLGIATTELNHGLLLDQVSNFEANNINIVGPLTTADLITAVDDTKAVEYNSTAALVVHHVSFNGCSFLGFTYGTDSQEEMAGVVYTSCDFDTLFRGMQIGGASPVNGGPTGVKIDKCLFDNIYNEGIYMLNVSLNVSSYNTFYDVGNHFYGSGTPAANIIYFDAYNNISVGDMFERNNTDAAVWARIALNDSNTTALSMNNRGITFYQANTAVDYFGNNMDLGTYNRSAGVKDTLANNSSGTLVTIDKTIIDSFIFDYKIRRANNILIGTITVAGGQGVTATGFTYSDANVSNGVTGVTLTPADSGTELSIGWATTNTGAVSVIKYSVTSFGI